MILATITAVHNDGVQLLINGEDEPTSKHYQCSGTFIPTVGQQVCVAEVGASYIVIGPYGAPMTKTSTAVATITVTTPTVTQLKDKINELLTALKANGTID